MKLNFFFFVIISSRNRCSICSVRKPFTTVFKWKSLYTSFYQVHQMPYSSSRASRVFLLPTTTLEDKSSTYIRCQFPSDEKRKQTDRSLTWHFLHLPVIRRRSLEPLYDAKENRRSKRRTLFCSKDLGNIHWTRFFEDTLLTKKEVRWPGKTYRTPLFVCITMFVETLAYTSSSTSPELVN